MSWLSFSMVTSQVENLVLDAGHGSCQRTHGALVCGWRTINGRSLSLASQKPSLSIRHLAASRPSMVYGAGKCWKKRRDAANRVYPVPFGAVAMEVKYWNLGSCQPLRFLSSATIATYFGGLWTLISLPCSSFISFPFSSFWVTNLNMPS